MKKVLFTATVDSHILHFHLPYLKLFKEEGYEVHVATNGKEEIPYCDKKHIISFERNPFKINNLKAIKQLKRIIEQENYEIIHTHTPMGSVVTRLAAKKTRKNGTRVIYTAHGFHFYKGAPLLNWILFYPIEKWLSKYTDTLITINDEDYQLAKKKFKKTNVEYVSGVGVDPKKFDIQMTDKEKKDLRKELGIKKEDFVMIYPAELSKRKRQLWLINTVKNLLKDHKDIHLLLPGKDSLKGKGHKLIKKLDLENQIHLLGYRNDIPKLLRISNLSLSSAKQEGLPVNLMEAMYVGIPIIASDCRGNRDLVNNEKNGFVIPLKKEDLFCQKIIELYNDKDKYSLFAENNKKIVKQYYLDEIIKYMSCIYLFNYEKNNKKESKVSLIIPVYNAEKYLDKCIKSLINQSYKNIEFIFINDGSKDNSKKILEEFQKKDNRIIIINQKNNGPSQARNEGIKKSTGKYIMFVDSDDWIEKDTVEKMLYYQEKYDSDIIYCNYIKEYQNKSIVHYIKKTNKEIEVMYFSSPNENNLLQRVFGNLNNNFIQPSCIENLSPSCMKLYKKEIMEKNNIFFIDHKKFGTGEDTLFNAEYFIFVKKAIYLNKALYHYRRNNQSSITRISALELIEKKKNLFKALELLIKKYLLPKEYYTYLNSRKAVSVITSGMCIDKTNISFDKKKNEIIKLLNDVEIRNALLSLNLKGMKIHWKIFFTLCQKRQYTIVLKLCKIMNKITLKK